MDEMTEKTKKKIAKKVSNKRDSHKLKHAERIDTTTILGLTSEQVDERIKKNLVNHKSLDKTKSYFKIFADNIFNFCNILILTLMILLICIGAWDYAISSSLIIVNIAIGIYQEIKAKKAVSKLSLVTQSKCDAIRDGKTVSIPTTDIVLDDIVILTAGQQIPVDGVVVEGSIEVDESIITGETEPIKKEETSQLLAGSNIISGEAAVRAERVGGDCYIEGIARIAKKLSKPKSEIFKTLDNLIKGISVVLVILATLLLVAERLSTEVTWRETIINVSSSMLGMIPVGMFLLTSTALASSVLRLSKKNALPQDLYSIEMLARVDTLLLDKTGTITDGNLEVADQFDINESSLNIKDILITMDENNKDKKPTALALKKYSEGANVLECTDALAFSSARKYSAITIAFNENDEAVEKTYILGAPDFICSKSEKLDVYCDRCSKQGKRTILLAEFDGSIDDIDIETTKPLCVFATEEHLKDEVKNTLKWFHENDVDIKIVSGDNPQTVSTIAQKTGVYGAEHYVNCNKVSGEELDSLVEGTAVFGRVSPEQKVAIVKSLQDKGHTVGMIGDGVNDVQALKASDCSISFGNANDVARNISRIVLLDNDFKSMPNIVEEGRRVIANVEKVSSLYIMKNIFVMFMTLLFAFVTIATRQSSYPFDTKKMLVIEFFVIGVPTFCYALLPNQARIKGNFLRNILKASFPSALSLIVATGFILLLTGHLSFDSSIVDLENYKISMATFALVMSGFAALLVISMPPNKIRIGIIIAMVITSIVCVYLDGIVLGGTFFGMQMLSIKDGVWIVLSTVIALIVNLIMRHTFDKLDLRYGDMVTGKFNALTKKLKALRK